MQRLPSLHAALSATTLAVSRALCAGAIAFTDTASISLAATSTESAPTTTFSATISVAVSTTAHAPTALSSLSATAVTRPFPAASARA